MLICQSLYPKLQLSTFKPLLVLYKVFLYGEERFKKPRISRRNQKRWSSWLSWHMGSSLLKQKTTLWNGPLLQWQRAVKLQLPSEDPVPVCPCKQGSTMSHAQVKINSSTVKTAKRILHPSALYRWTKGKPLDVCANSGTGKVAQEHARTCVPEHVQWLCSTANLAR